MSKAVGRRAHVLEIRKLLNQKKYDIGVESDLLVTEADEAASLEKGKQHYASCRIQGIVRGFLARIMARQMLVEYRAGNILRRVARGKLGRMKWMLEYWKSISVVKSPEALEALLERSVPHRDSKEAGGPAWRELYDPVSGAFWYYERKTKMTTWNCPLALQKNLVCSWNGYAGFGGLPSDGPCRVVFDNIAQYQGHLANTHKWFCVACGNKNFGASFPVCNLCGNSSSSDAEDGHEVLETAVKEVGAKISMYLHEEQDLVHKRGDKFVLKDHLVKLAVDLEEKRKRKEERKRDAALKAGKLIASSDASQSESSASKSLASKSVASSIGKTGTIAHTHKTASTTANSATTGTGTTSSVKKKKTASLSQRRDIEAARIAAGWEKNDRLRRKKILKVTGCMLPLAPLFDTNGNEGPPVLYQDKDDSVNPNQYAGLFRSVTEAHDAKQWIKNGGIEGERERFRNPLTKGIIPVGLFERIVKVKDPQEQSSVADSDEDSEDEFDETKTGSQTGDSTEEAESVEETLQDELIDFLGDNPRQPKMLVCAAYLDGKCSKSVCERAHPGKRDDAVIESVRLPNRPRKTLYVECCPDYDGSVITGCKLAGNCKKYHIYIRPSTRDIILRIYPKEEGEKSKILPSGAEITGNLHNNKMEGYGVMTWVNGATYSGNWCNDLRSGFGTYRTPLGTEYAGGWLQGKRHGFGCYINNLGEEYVGEWKDGKMDGCGRLTAANGDTYYGYFKSHKYHGVGVFSRVNGDKFMGYSVDGMACGLGIVSLGTGEKYKGLFDRNFRHGKGVCSYSNGAKYAGMWYRGVPHGFGIFVAPNGERYVGEFAGGKKHGHGRYFFQDGSFYDGEFHKNKAQGQGVYFFACGDKYSGAWHNDKRNGRGTYQYANGTVYTGNWVDNNIDGKGKMDWFYGAHYRGEFKRNCKHGRGIFTWPNGNCYKGMFDRDKLCGAGHMTYTSGHSYKGMWLNNMKHGKGTFSYVNGAIYEGDWIEDGRHGKGKLTFLPGTFIEESYDGDWEKDEKHGHGVYRYRADEGTVYDGQWEHNRREGVGKLSYLDGSYYKGDFHEEKMSGRGVYVGADGSQYEGEWLYNMRNGIGTLLGADGTIYHGNFHNNMKHGHGKIQHPNGDIFEGDWEGNVVRGATQSAKYTLAIGATSRGGPEEVKVRCFPY